MKQFLLELIFTLIKIFLNGFHQLSHLFSNIKTTHNYLITIIICYTAVVFNLILTIGNINTFLFAIKLINLKKLFIDRRFLYEVIDFSIILLPGFITNKGISEEDLHRIYNELIYLEVYVNKIGELLQNITMKNLFILLIFYLIIWAYIFLLIIYFNIYLLAFILAIFIALQY